MSSHWIWGVGFLALAAGGIGYGAKSGVEAGLAAAKAREEVQARPEPLSDEILREKMREAALVYQRGNRNRAVRMLELLTVTRPDSANVWLNLGIARLGADDPKGARVAFERTLDINSEDWHAVAELGNIHLEAADLGAALVEFGKVPAGKGQMSERLLYDDRWSTYVDDPRVQALREKHGVPREPTDEERLRRGLQRERAAAEPAEVGTTTPSNDEGSPSPAVSQPPTESVAEVETDSVAPPAPDSAKRGPAASTSTAAGTVAPASITTSTTADG